MNGLDALSVGAMVVISVGAYARLFWRGMCDPSSKKKAPTSYLQQPYVSTIPPYLKKSTNKQTEPNPATKIIPIASAKTNSR